ncbi:MAG: hypothetical protein H7318_09185 [Oligoflexus sp.]|nr:hypothetical protein [Oligoflexus sp.]
MPTLAKITLYLRKVAWLWLAANVCIASIPRCDALFSAWLTTASLEEHCHEDQASERPALQSAHLCQCSLLSFVFNTVQWSDPTQVILAAESYPSLSGYLYRSTALDLALEIESPPPKV